MPTRGKIKRSTPRRRTTTVVARPSKGNKSSKITKLGKVTKLGKITKLKLPGQSGRTDASKRTLSVAMKVVSKVVTPVERSVPNAPSGSSNWARAIRFLNTLADYERLRIVRYNEQNFNLDRMRALLKKLGNPQDAFRSVHVAGTKGKGSTCAMVAAMVQANGYKVGLYTSPHLIDVRERITINGEMIPHAEFSRITRLVEPMVAKIKPTPTYFDVLTAVAFKWFAEQKIEIGVIETGLGGRLDSTNVLKPEVTAISSISKDHMQQLGPTLRHIATEKAGIIKPGVPCVTVIQDPVVEEVIKATAERVGAPLDICGKTIEFSYRFESSRLQGPHNRICLTTAQSKFEHLAVPMIGEHQAINCGLALSIVDKLKTRGIALNDTRSMEGLSKVSVPGRMEIISTSPRVLVDGAHNAASIDALIRSVGQHIPYDSMVLIFGCCADKDVGGMLERVSQGADKVIFTKVNNIRTADPHELASRYVEQYGKMAQVADSLEQALSIANRAVTKEDLICISGSFYLVGEAIKYFAAKQQAQHALAQAAKQN